MQNEILDNQAEREAFAQFRRFTIHAGSKTRLTTAVRGARILAGFYHGAALREAIGQLQEEHARAGLGFSFSLGHHVTGDAAKDYDWHAYCTSSSESSEETSSDQGAARFSAVPVLSRAAFDTIHPDYKSEPGDPPRMLWNDGARGTASVAVEIIDASGEPERGDEPPAYGTVGCAQSAEMLARILDDAERLAGYYPEPSQVTGTTRHRAACAALAAALDIQMSKGTAINEDVAREAIGGAAHAFAVHLVSGYMAGGPGYSGPVFMILWDGSPGFVSTVTTQQENGALWYRAEGHALS